MFSWDFTRSVTGMRLLADFAGEHDLPLSDVLAGTRVTQAQLSDPAAIVTASQELRMTQNLVEKLGHIPALGIHVGKRYHFTAYGPLGFAIVSSRTGRDAMNVAMRYFHLTFAYTRFVVEDTEEHIRTTIHDDEVPQSVRRFIIERDSAALITALRDIFGLESMLELLSFNYEPPDCGSCYEDFFGLKPTYNANQNVALLNKERMEQRLPQANDLALEVAEKQCEVILNQRVARSGLAVQIRSHLALRAADMPAMDAVASRFCMTTRTLRRRLETEHTSFAQLRNEVRRMLADEYLLNLDLPVEQVANKLGYAESTSFINAFKNWYGVTPHAYRLRKACNRPANIDLKNEG
ncbi:AraC family transcriptional regulator [Oleiphilus messinensis]|uniref:AraC family transcriptional regulator n=1 Tax=Oleiphilus messinensis TaxID=141451 RepID=A0A1Y0IBB9_9GAMM|nr:AraC family transcriptional regulator [Oleiphilus messinensis]ARU56714.1 AraC family transcriptional regulator [Oleiphilus messinensis]